MPQQIWGAEITLEETVSGRGKNSGYKMKHVVPMVVVMGTAEEVMASEFYRNRAVKTRFGKARDPEKFRITKVDFKIKLSMSNY